MVFTRIVVKTEESQAGPARARGNGKHINLLTREFRQTVALYGSPAAGNSWRGELRSLVFPPRTGDCSCLKGSLVLSRVLHTIFMLQ